MADLNDILAGLRDEVWKKIITVQPQERGTGELSFEYVPANKGTLSEMTGRVRIFGVRLMGLAAKWCGDTGRRYDLSLEVRIGYPKSDWEMTAASDFGVIRSALNAGGAVSSVPGVAFRYVQQNGMRLEYTDEWMWSTIILDAVVEAT